MTKEDHELEGKEVSFRLPINSGISYLSTTTRTALHCVNSGAVGNVGCFLEVKNAEL